MTLDRQILRFDIETVPQRSSEEEAVLSPLYTIWGERYCKDKPDDMSVWERYYERSALFPEFSKIVCISIGRHQTIGIDSPTPQSVEGFKVKSLYGEEYQLLTEFRDILLHDSFRNWKLWGHNIKWFDISFVAKRMIMNQISVPSHLNVIGKKPRDIPHIDTQELRQLGRTVSTSLELMCVSLGVESPKQEIDGKEVKKIFYSDHDTEYKRDIITRYCEADVLATYDCYATILSYL